MNKHSTLIVTIDGAPPVGPREAEHARIAKSLVMLAGRIGFAKRGADGSLVAVPDEDVELDVAQLQLQNMAAPPDTLRGMIAALASVLKGHEDAASRPPDPPRPAPPTRDDAARAAGIDLVRQEAEAEARLAAIRAARERHRQLVLSGDATGAAEVKP